MTAADDANAYDLCLYASFHYTTPSGLSAPGAIVRQLPGGVIG